MKIEKAMRNALSNVDNRYQNLNKRVLCICSAGLLRSPSIARILSQEFDYNTRAAGVDLEYALIPVSHLLLEWADEIVCAESWHADEIKYIIEDLYGSATKEVLKEKPIICLNIRDAYGYMDGALQQLIVEKYNEAESMSALQYKLAKELNIKD